MADEQPNPDPKGTADPATAKVQGDLYQSAYMGNSQGVRQALANGANVNGWQEQTGLTALHLAVGTNNFGLVKYLIETAGAEIVPDRSGRWPTVIAAECCAGEELCDYIVEQEAKVLQS